MRGSDERRDHHIASLLLTFYAQSRLERNLRHTPTSTRFVGIHLGENFFFLPWLDLLRSRGAQVPSCASSILNLRMSVDNLYMSTVEVNRYIVFPLCAAMSGLDKGGIPGLAALGMTVLVSVHPEGGVNRVVATFVPILLIADLGAAWAYRDAVDWSIIRLVVGPMICGIFAGVMVIGQLDEDEVKKTVGFALLVLACSHFFLKWYNTKRIDPLLPSDRKSDCPQMRGTDSITSNDYHGTAQKTPVYLRKRKNFALAILSGFAVGVLTMVANVAGPIATAYFLSLEIPKRELNGTRAYLFLIANFIKTPVQIALGNLLLDDIYKVFFLVIIALVATLVAERFILNYIDQKSFEMISWVLVIVGAVKLLFDGIFGAEIDER